jgi:cystathionine gamma-synthase
MTHATLADSVLAVPGNLIRLSVGVESARDLIEDLELALASVPTLARRS